MQQKLYTKTITLLVNTDPKVIVSGDDYKKWLSENINMGNWVYGGADPALKGLSQGALVSEFIKDQGMSVTQTGGTDKTTTTTTTTTP